MPVWGQELLSVEEWLKLYELCDVRIKPVLNILTSNDNDRVFPHYNWIELQLPICEYKETPYYEGDMPKYFADLDDDFKELVILSENIASLNYFFEAYMLNRYGIVPIELKTMGKKQKELYALEFLAIHDK